MAAITANGLYGDRARSLFSMAMPANNGSATSSTSAQSVMEKTLSSMSKLAGNTASTNKDIIRLLNKQVQLLTVLTRKDGGLSISDLLIAKYLGKFASAAAAGIGSVAGGIGTLAGGVARTIKGGVGKAFDVLKVGMIGGINRVVGTVTSGITSFFKPIMSGVKAITGLFTMGNAGKIVSTVVSALPRAIGIIGRGISKLFWPLTAAMGIFDGFKGAFNADKILGKNKTSMFEKFSVGLSEAINGVLLGAPNWISKQFGFQNFAQFNDKIQESIKGVFTSIYDNVSGGISKFSATVSDGFSRFKDKLGELGDWARNLLNLGPAATPEQINNAKSSGARVGAIISQAAGNPTTPKSSAIDVKGLMSADRLDKIQENLNSQQVTAQTTPVAKAAITTTTAAVTAINEVTKTANAAIEDNTKKSKGLLEKLVGNELSDNIGDVFKGLNAAADTLQADMMKSIGHIAGASASYIAGTPTNSGINSPGNPGAIRGRGGSSGGAGATGSWISGTAGATGGTGGTLGALVAGAESAADGYNAYNKGTSGGRIIGADKKQDIENMSIGEIMRRQALPMGDPDRLFATGKYQVIPDTMKEGVAKLGLDPNQKFDKDTQERFFRDYLVGAKRPQIRDFITGKSDSKAAAIEALSNEFASFGGVNGYGKYGSGNKVSVGPQQSGAALDAMRNKYAEGIKNGLSTEEAYAQAFGAAGVKSISQVVGNGLIPVKQSDGSTKMVNPNGAQGQAFGGGATNTATTQLAQVLQGQGQVPGGINRFTAFNDNYHAGSRSKHASGLAMDFTLNDASKSAEAAEFMRSQLRKAGLKDDQFKVIDEYLNPSSRATAGHIHSQFADAAAAAIYSKFASENPEALKAQGINKLTDEEKYKSSPFGNTPEAIARRKTIAGIQALKDGNLTTGIDSLPDVAKSFGEAVGKAVTDRVESPKTPEFVPTPAAPLGGTTPQAAGSAVTTNPTGASTSPVNTPPPNVREVPSIDEYSMLLPNSTMMA